MQDGEKRMNYREAREFLEGCNRYAGEELSLGPLSEMLRRLGDPQDRLSLVHIAGTNGKGSTLAFISSVLQEAGYRVGRYISPTIFEYRERIQVNGTYIPEEDLARLTELRTEEKEILSNLKNARIHKDSAQEEKLQKRMDEIRQERKDLIRMRAAVGKEQRGDEEIDR